MKWTEVYVALLGSGIIYVGAIFLNFIGIDAINGSNPYQFFADSNTYHSIYGGDATLYHGELIGVSSNYLGPLSILHLLNGNYYLVLMFNVMLFCGSVIAISRNLGCSALWLCCILLLNPLTLSSIMSVNKEILVFPFIAIAIAGWRTSSIVLIVLALVVSLLSRWQLTLAAITLLILAYVPIKSRALRVALMAMAVSVLYYFAKSFLEPVLAFSALSIENYDGEGSGLFERTIEIQNGGFYILVFPIKALHLMCGMLPQAMKMFSYENFYNDVMVMLHSLSMLCISVWLLFRHKITLKQDWIYASVVFLLIFSLTPVFSPRYLYPVYVFLCLALVSKESLSKSLVCRRGYQRGGRLL